MSLTIYASDKTTLKYTISAAQATQLHQSLNGECLFDLTMPGRLIKNVAVGDEIRLGDLYFDVVRVGKNAQATGTYYTVNCEHISYELADMPQYTAHYSGTAAAVLATILSGTGFSVGTVTVSGTHSVTINNDTSKRDALQQWAVACNAELSYTGRNINFLTRVGSATAVSLAEKENVKSLSVTMDSRSDTQSYSIELSRLQHLSLGDSVTISYPSLNINVTKRVITLDYDPFHPMAISMVIGDYVPNFTGAVSSALEARIKEGEPYYGVTIDRATGIRILRSDEMSEAIFNSDLFTMRAKINGTMQDRIYFDPIKGDYVFAGALSSDAVFTDSLYAEIGDIAELTVDQLSTSRRVKKYLLHDTTDDNFIKIFEQTLQFVTGEVVYSEPESGQSQGTAQREWATNRYNAGLYWEKIPSSVSAQGYPLDENGRQIYATTTVPAEATQETIDSYKVWVYQYNDRIKAKFNFENLNNVYTPVLTLGLGDQNGNDKTTIVKRQNEFDLLYKPSSGAEIGLKCLLDGHMDLFGLRKTTSMDFSNWSSGYFSETLDGVQDAVNYAVDFDLISGRPVKITDADGNECNIYWPS